MNITYWIVVTVLISIAFLIILPPLWKKSSIKSADSDQRNIDIAKERAKDLKNQLKAGNLSQQQFDDQHSELELTLGDDLDIQQVDQSFESLSGRWIVPVLALCIPIISVPTYYAIGEPDALIKAEMKPQTQTQEGQDINAMVMKLAKRLKENPNNAKDWLMLGRSFKYLKQYQLAVNSFKKAHELLGDDPELLLQYADALTMVNNGSLAGKPSELVFKALEKIPDSVTGLWLAGMAKAEEKNFTQALVHWHKLRSILPKNSKSYEQVQTLINAVQAQSTNVMPTRKEETVTAEVDASVSINVKVDLTAGIKAKVNSGDTVFIYAKALTGPPMPLAIVRKNVSDLPLTITLNDQMAMMPTMKLSNFKAVKVVARISKSGSAMPQKGDYLGSFELPELNKSQSVAIVINSEI